MEELLFIPESLEERSSHALNYLENRLKLKVRVNLSIDDYKIYTEISKGGIMLYKSQGMHQSDLHVFFINYAEHMKLKEVTNESLKLV